MVQTEGCEVIGMTVRKCDALRLLGIIAGIKVPKKSQRQQHDESQLIAWYKWEFLRRNTEYRKDYEEFIQEFGDWFRLHGYWYEHDNEPWGKKNLLFFARVIAPKAKTICERWQIRDPVAPTMTFERPGCTDCEHQRECSLPTDCSKEEAGHAWDLADFVADSRLSEEEFRNRLPDVTAKTYGPEPDYRLELVFDLRFPLDFLLREAEDRLRSRKRSYDRRHPSLSKISATVRRRLDLYDRYLRVWDLRNAGEKFEAIGALVFRDEQRRAQHARDSFYRAQELIDGGYKELR